MNELLLELQKKKNILELDINEIDSQLYDAKVKAKTTGIYSDPEWFKKANYVLNKKKIELKSLNIQLNDLRKKIDYESGSSINKQFVNVAREMLNEETFLHIMKIAKERRAEVE